MHDNDVDDVTSCGLEGTHVDGEEATEVERPQLGVIDDAAF